MTRPNAARRAAADHREDGFTLVELLVVLAIIVLVAGIVAPQVLRYLAPSRARAAEAQIANLENALELFYIDNLRYPTTEEGLAALSEPTADLAARWNGPYMRDAGGLRDPWGHSYVYRDEDGTPVLLSLGRDGSPGGSGEDADIANRGSSF